MPAGQMGNFGRLRLDRSAQRRTKTFFGGGGGHVQNIKE